MQQELRPRQWLELWEVVRGADGRWSTGDDRFAGDGFGGNRDCGCMRVVHHVLTFVWCMCGHIQVCDCGMFC